MVADYNGRDEEGQDITWSLDGTDVGDFMFDPTSGVLSFSSSPNHEGPTDNGADKVYNIIVTASDTASPVNTRELNVTVTVDDVNERPDIREDTVANYMEVEYDFTGTPLDVHTFAATDYDDLDTFTWSLDGVDKDLLEIDSMSGVLTFKQDSNLNVGPLPNFEQPQDDTGDGSSNTYNVTVRATDDDTIDPKYSDYAVTITVNDVNEQPEFTGTPLASDDWNENDDRMNTLLVHEYAARDEEGSVTWSLIGPVSGEFDIDSSGVVTFNTVPDYEALADLSETDGRHPLVFTVVATDTMSGSTRRSANFDVTITVMDLEEAGTVALATLPNDPPLVDDELTFTLSDPDGGILLTSGNIDWTIEARVPADPPDDSVPWESIDDADPLSLVKTYTVDEDHTGKEMRATVTYKDRRSPPDKMATSGESSSVQDERDVAPLRFRTGATQTIEEGEPGRDTEQEITATDRDGEALIFGIQPGPHSDLFELVPSAETTMMNYGGIDYPEYTAQLRAIEALDYETISTNPMVLTLTLSDGKEESNGRVIYDDTNDVDDFKVTITVTNVDEPGEITFSPEEVPEPEVATTATLTDGDGRIGGQMWQWQRSEEEEDEEADWTDIPGATSSSYRPDETADVISGGDNDGEGYYLRATVDYTDGEGGSKSAMAIAGQVGTANQRPQFPSAETRRRTVPEKTRAGVNIGDPVAAEDPENNRLVYSLTGIDAESFTIVSSTGQLRVRDPLDYEIGRTVFFVDVNVHDRRDAAGASSTYVDDTLTNMILTVENVEEPGTVTLSTPTNRVQATVPVTAELSDPDIPSGITWQWARSSNRSTWDDITGATTATYSPSVTTEGNPGDQCNYLRSTASYTGVDGSSDQSAEAVTSRVGDPPPTNSAPVFPTAEDGQREVREDFTAGTPIGDPVEATDHNNDLLTYSLSGSDATSFTIDANTGRLRLAQDVILDYERKRTYRFTVRVTDGANQDDVPDDDRVDDTNSVTVSVTDVSEAPVITGEAEREFRENGTSSVATYSARDPEGDTITWSVDDAHSFVITDRGQLYFVEPPSFEDGDTYQVTITATDDDGTIPLSASLNVTVTVTDLEEQGTVSIFPVRGWVVVGTGTEAEPEVQTRFTATLEDGDDPITNLSWQWSRSSSEPIEGATSDSYIATGDDVGRYLRVTATYQDNRSVDPMDPTNITEKTVTAVLRTRIGDTKPEANTQPEFAESTDTRNIASGAAAGRSIGARVSATDADGDVLTYMLRGGAADKFDIDAATGQLRTKAALDYEEEDTYTVSVSVHDGFDALYRPSASIDDTIHHHGNAASTAAAQSPQVHT